MTKNISLANRLKKNLVFVNLVKQQSPLFDYPFKRNDRSKLTVWLRGVEMSMTPQSPNIYFWKFIALKYS